MTGGTSAPLTVREGGLPAGLRKRFPQLADYEALVVPKTVRRQIATILTGQLAVASFRPDGSLATVTGVQLPGVLDDVYQGARTRTLGPVWRDGRPSLRLWAPTAQHVDVLMAPVGSATERRIAMTRDDDGVWQVRGDSGWRNARYRFEVTVYAPTTQKVENNLVTDPYSLALTTDSARSSWSNLDAAALKPSGWNRLRKPTLPKPEYSTDLRVARPRLLDLATRRFPPRIAARIWPSPTAPATECGTCESWPAAGLNTRAPAAGQRHRVRSRRTESEQAEPGLRPGLVPAGERAAAGLRHRGRRQGRRSTGATTRCTTRHRRAPTRRIPNGTARNRRVPAHGAGAQSGRAAGRDGRRLQPHPGVRSGPDKSILDRVVPGYYQRLNATGQVETSTCCSNTATEHADDGKADDRLGAHLGQASTRSTASAST